MAYTVVRPSPVHVALLKNHPRHDVLGRSWSLFLAEWSMSSLDGQTARAYSQVIGGT